MLVELAVALVALDGPAGQAIWVNPAEIVSLRAPRESKQEHFAPEIKCVIQAADGKLINVADGCEEVRRRIGEPNSRQ